MTPSGPGLLFAGRFLITVSISMLVVKKVHEAHVLLLPVIADPAQQGHFLPLQLGKALLQFPGGDDGHGKTLLGYL